MEKVVEKETHADGTNSKFQDKEEQVMAIIRKFDKYMLD